MNAWLTLLETPAESGQLAGLVGFKLASCIALSCALFAIGAWGVLARRNILVMLISIELMLNAVMLAFVSFARWRAGVGAEYAEEAAKALANGAPAETIAKLQAQSAIWMTSAASGQIFGLFIIAVAAAEAAVGLAIVISYYRHRETVDTRDLTTMKF